MKQIAAIFCFLLFASACKKDSTSPADQTDQQKQDLLINKKWKLVDLRAKGTDGKTSDNQVSTIPAYEQDDYFYFYGNLKYSLNDNAIRNPDKTSSTLDTGSWLLNNSILTVTSNNPNNSQSNFKLTAISANSLSYEVYSDNSKSTIYFIFNTIQ